MTEIRYITTKEELDQLFLDSATKPAFVFKHSTICPASTRALNSYQAFVAEARTAEFFFAGLMIRDHRDLSNELAQRTGVKHESPQVLLIIDGQAVWHDSHFEITEEKLRQVVMMYENKDLAHQS